MNPRVLTRFLRLALAVAGLISCLNQASAVTYGQRVVAAVLLAEARGEGKDAMYAVAEVIRNRADRYNVSPLAVVKKKRQFACLNNTTPPALVRRYQNHKLWPQALAIARTAYNQPERLPGVANGATHFHSHHRVVWARGYQPVAVFGRLKFYRIF